MGDTLAKSNPWPLSDGITPYDADFNVLNTPTAVTVDTRVGTDETRTMSADTDGIVRLSARLCTTPEATAQTAAYIRKHGYDRFLKIADTWRGAYGRYE